MDFLELLSSAFEALTLNKLRTMLATLGIVIGIGSVIALVSLGQASQKKVQASIQSLGSNLLTVIPGAQKSGGIVSTLGSNTSLTYDDANAIATSPLVTTIQLVSPELNRGAQVTAEGNNANIEIIGALPAYTKVHNLTISEGSFFTSSDNNSLSKMAVIGPQAANTLFGTQDPVGKSIRINKLAFLVLGVTASKGGSGFGNQDNTVFVPLFTAQREVFGDNYLSSISLQAKSQNIMTETENQVGYLLLKRHNETDPSQADFSILSQTDILEAASSITGTFTALLSGIAAISLLVGGIGIMNIMLVTVTERIREIGLRKALGAHRTTVVLQFLVEAVMLTITGGIIGMILGIIASFVVSSLIKLPFTISLSAVLLAIGVSGSIGIIFGWYPAQKAANLSPIEALRYE